MRDLVTSKLANFKGLEWLATLKAVNEIHDQTKNMNFVSNLVVYEINTLMMFMIHLSVRVGLDKGLGLNLT